MSSVQKILDKIEEVGSSRRIKMEKFVNEIMESTFSRSKKQNEKIKLQVLEIFCDCFGGKDDKEI